jgi:fibronectin-binding autotransporter adhesin
LLRDSATQRILSLVGVIVVVLLMVSSLGGTVWYVLSQPSKTLVTTLQDSDTVAGSLRWCIDNAPSGSTLRFAQGLRGIIELKGGDLIFAGGKQLTIAGPGANQLTISGGNKNAKIHVSRNAIVGISGLSFKNSETVNDAFLFNEGTFTMTNSVISSNKTITTATSFAGGSENVGTLTVKDSTISNNSSIGGQGSQGGGIGNYSKLTVTQSTFSNNSASSSGSKSFGGGIENTDTGTLMVTSSAFSANTASGKQGSLGGSIVNGGKLTVTTSTISNNSANSYGGGILSFGTKGSFAIIRFSTIYGNKSNAGGGIWVDPTGSSHMTISSSIIAANSAHDGPDISGALISDGYNLIENVAGSKGLNATTDKQVTLTELGVSPTLGNNGRPTQTLALLQGSKAIDAVPLQACSIIITDTSGHNVTITTDQRGDARPDGSENACDIGAYESSYEDEAVASSF